MGIQRVRSFLQTHAPEITVTELEAPTATVIQAAEAFGVEHGQIAKSLSFRVNDQVVLVVMAGDRRLDNRKYKEFFGVKARMLAADEVEMQTGFAPGGVCPFGINPEVNIYCDESLLSYPEVLPAGGNARSGVRISPKKLASITGAKWVSLSVDVNQKLPG